MQPTNQYRYLLGLQKSNEGRYFFVFQIELAKTKRKCLLQIMPD